jgi:ABC-type antimicrobial peptide transport system permease subunit
LARETILLAFFGSVAGILLTFVARWAILHYIPASMTQEIVPDWWGYGLIISICAALLGSLYPGLKAARQDAIEALSYE